LTPLLFAAALLLSLQPQAFSQTCTNLCQQQQICSGGGTTSLSGYVFDPANNLPVPNAIVYVPNGTVQPFVDGPAAGPQISGSPLVATTTNIAGHFTLNNMPVGTNIPLVVQAGLWRRQFTIPTINSCTANTLSGGNAGNSGNLTLPANHTQGDIPKIAIVTGSDSSVECVALKIGVSQSEFTDPGGSGRINLYEGDGLGGAVVSGSSSAESTLFSSQANLNAYDVVLFGSQGQTDPDAITANQLELANFANAGGRVFAETMAYGWLDGNSTFSGTVNWNPGQGSWANYLSDTTYPSLIDTTLTRSMELGQWLNQAIVYGGTLDQIPVGVIRNDFTSVISPTHRWLYTANDVNVGGNGQGPGPNIPLQFTFDTPVGSSSQPGRVWFNDYLVNAEQNSSGYHGVPFPAECPTGGLTPQEKLFEYGLFDLTTSLGAPTATVAVTNSPSTFTQGDSSDTLTINIAGTSASALDSSLTLTAALPTGLTAVSMAGQNSGTAWTCNSSTLVCTRNASLGLAAIDPITLTVAVAANATTGTGALTVSATAANGGLGSSVNGSDAVTIAAGGCTSDAQCSAGSWCNESLRACVPTLANNVPLPTDPSHTNPTLNGMCSSLGAAALVCTSGVCDTSTNKCGYSTGDGVCNQTNAATVCDSGACSVSNVCEPAGGCEVNADCSSGMQCSATKACIPSLSVTAWPTASPINLGQTLAASTLTGGTASVSGSFGWTDPATVPPVGTSSQSATFSPTDTINYAPLTGSVSILVNGPSTNLVVTTTADDTGTAANCTLQPNAGTGSDPSCSLRDALLFAGNAGSGKISFDGTTFSVSNSVAGNTINLSNGALNIPTNTTVTYGPAIITVATAAGTGPPVGNLGNVEDNVTFSATVGRSDSVEVQGWVADPQDGAPLTNVTVYVDGTSIGAPTLGLARPSIAATYNNIAYLNSGYQLLYPASSLVLGTHYLTVVAIDSGGRATTFGPRTFTVAATAGAGSPFGVFGVAVDNVTSSTTVSQADSIRMQGWVADPQDGAPLGNVKVYVDGTSIGAPILGVARPDVAAAYGNAYLNSGFRLLYPASSLAPGTHQVTVVAIDSGGRSITLGPRSITVQ
jgi:hypothetical protein